MNEELRIEIRADAGEARNELRQVSRQLQNLGEDAATAANLDASLTKTLTEQSKALRELKIKYIDLANVHGKESDAAKNLANQIKNLSEAYQNNRQIVTDLANNADSFDMSLGGDGQATSNINNVNDALGNVQTTLNSIQNLSVWDIILEAFGGEVAANIEKITTSFGEFQTAMSHSMMMFFNPSQYFYETGIEFDNFGDRMQAAAEAWGEAWTSFGEGIGEVFSTLGTALKGFLGLLLVVVGEILIIIGLVKNALARAKEIKAMAAEASKVGMETNSYEEWGYVLKQVGIEADNLTDFIKTLNDEQNAVRDGSEDTIKAFEAIGLSAEEVMGSNQEELFQKTVEGLQNVENAAERTSLAYRIFGEDAAELTNILYLSNDEVQSLINNYNNLGAGPSANLIKQSKILESSTTNLSYAWEGLKNTLAEWVMPIIITIVQGITTAVAYLNVFLQGIFGVEIGFDKAASGVGSVNSGLTESVKTAEKLRRITLGFDELNIVGNPNESSGSSSGSGGNGFGNSALNPELPVIEVPDLTAFRDFMNEYGSLIQGILTWSFIAIGVILAVLGGMSGNLALLAIGVGLAGLGIGIGAAGEESHWKILGNAIMNNVITPVKNGFVSAWEAIKKAFHTVWDPIANFFGTTLPNTFKTVMNWLKTNIAEPIANFYNKWIKPVVDKIIEIVQKCVEIIVVLNTGLWNTLKTKIIDPIAKAFSTAWDAVTNACSIMWEKIKKIFSPIVSWFANIFELAWTKVKNVFRNWADFFGNLWNIIKDKFAALGTIISDAMSKAIKAGINGIITAIEKTINGAIGLINSAITLINKLPIGGDIKQLDKLQLPRLAKGGIVTSSTIANIGEAGREAVLPLENNTGWMNILADKIAERNSSPSKIVLMLDGKELGWAAVNSINDLTKQTGTLQLVTV